MRKREVQIILPGHSMDYQFCFLVNKECILKNIQSWKNKSFNTFLNSLLNKFWAIIESSLIRGDLWLVSDDNLIQRLPSSHSANSLNQSHCFLKRRNYCIKNSNLKKLEADEWFDKVGVRGKSYFTLRAKHTKPLFVYFYRLPLQ